MSDRKWTSAELRAKHKDLLFPSVGTFYEEPVCLDEGKGARLGELSFGRFHGRLRLREVALLDRDLRIEPGRGVVFRLSFLQRLGAFVGGRERLVTAALRTNVAENEDVARNERAGKGIRRARTHDVPMPIALGASDALARLDGRQLSLIHI